MRRRHGYAALGSALVAFALASGPTAAGPLDPPPPGLLFTGTGPTSATFTLAKPTTLDLRRATLSMTGDYGGVLVLSAKGTPYAGVVRFRALDDHPVPDARPLLAPAPSHFAGAPRPTLPPGTYTAHLLGNGDTEVLLPLEQGDPKAVRATGPSAQWFKPDQTIVKPSTKPETVPLRHEFTRKANSWSFLWGEFVADGAADEPAVGGCFTRDTACGASYSSNSAEALMPGSSLTVGTSMSPGQRRDGPWRALVDTTSGITGGGRLRLVYLQVDV